MASVTLNNGRRMPIVGFGLWKVNNETCADTVYNAIKTGYRLFDGALDYGNECEAGQGVARAISDGLVKREDLFIVSKLWPTFYAPDRVEATCKMQLDLWQLKYFDLYYMHFPVSLEFVDPETSYPPGWKNSDGTVHHSKHSLESTYHKLEELVDKGLANSIGISNFSGQTILDVLRYSRIKPQALQIEHHPYLTQEQLVVFAKASGIAVVAYSSLGPTSYHELDNVVAQGTPTLLDHDTIRKIANRHGKTNSQVLLRWSTQRGIAVIPKSNNQSRLEHNLSATDFTLSDDEIKEVSALNRNIRFNDPITEGLPIFV